MEGKPNGKGTSFERLKDKFFRFKLPRRSSRISMEVQFKPAESTSQTQDDYDYPYDVEYRKISPKDLQSFCEQLEKFLKYVQSIHHLTYMSYGYPGLLQDRLEKDAKDLQSLFLEVREALNSIERLKLQKQSVRKEKSAVKKTLRKLREDEVREMENVISLYDKTMFTRWENVKNTHKPEVLEILLHDIKGKQQALEHLNTLVLRKLGQLQLFMPLSTNAESVPSGISNNSNVNSREKTPNSTVITTSTSNNTGDERQSNTAIRRHHQHAQSSSSTRSYRRRRHNERQESHLNNRHATVETAGIDLPLVPFTIGSSPLQILSPILADGVNSNHSILSGSSTSNTTTTVRSSENGATNNAGATTVGSEFHSEMRNVLQALFGELRQTTPTTITINSETTENTAASNSNREIELYTIRRGN